MVLRDHCRRRHLRARCPISSGRHVKGKVFKELQTDSGVPSEVQNGPDSAIADPTGEGSPMKSPLAALALCSALAISTAQAQAQPQPSSFGAIQPKSPYGNLTPAPTGSEVLQS